MELTETVPPIEFEWYVTGPKGARFTLYPVKDKNTLDDVVRAKAWLYHQRDVVSLQIRWKQLGDETPNPEKIPDYAIIKLLKKEIGSLTSYIQDLEYKLAQREKAFEGISRIPPEERRKINKTQMYQDQQAQIKTLQKELQRAKRDNEDLIIKLNQKK